MIGSNWTKIRQSAEKNLVYIILLQKTNIVHTIILLFQWEALLDENKEVNFIVPLLEKKLEIFSSTARG